MDPVRQKIIDVARSQLGNHDPKMYWKEVLGAAPYPKHWCGALTLWCLHQAEVCVDMRWEIGKGFLYQLSTTTKPFPGDVGYIDAPYQHHFIVVDTDTNSVRSIDGNSGNAPTTVLEHVRPLHNSGITFYSIDAYIAYK